MCESDEPRPNQILALNYTVDSLTRPADVEILDYTTAEVSTIFANRPAGNRRRAVRAL